MSILFITHDLGIIAENASRVGIMYAGRLMELADSREIFKNPRHPYTIGLLESIPKKEVHCFNPIPGVVPRPEDLPAGCKFMDRCRYAIGECGIREPELREIAARTSGAVHQGGRDNMELLKVESLTKYFGVKKMFGSQGGDTQGCRRRGFFDP